MAPSPLRAQDNAYTPTVTPPPRGTLHPSKIGPKSRPRSDTETMSDPVKRHHWINTIVGILDQAFHLTDEEQFYAIDITGRLLDSLYIPGRSMPQVLPTPVVLEMTSGLYSNQLAGPRISGVVRPIRRRTEEDVSVSVEAWREFLLSLLLVAYPDIDPTERIVTAKILTDLLTGIGVPNRAASFYPEDVIRVANEVDAP